MYNAGMSKQIETIIIGAGQAGLATSYYLKQKNREHLVLEQATKSANAWRNHRWDSFCLNSPNWYFRLPGMEYQGDAPEGFMPRDEIVACFDQYIDRYHLPISYQTQVIAVEPIAKRKGYLVSTIETRFEARNVVIATGLFQAPRLPSKSANLPAHITQLHTSQYRNPEQLPPGGVLVVGSAQSGCQIAEELYQAGRRVYLCVGSAGRFPRRYRGKDIFEWMHLTGFLDRTVDMLPNPKAKFAGNPHLTGRDGGRSLNLHQFARDGVVLLGRFQGAQDDTIFLFPDIKQTLAKVDGVETEMTKLIDGYIAKTGLDAPLESLPVLRDGYAVEEITKLNLSFAGITTIIWAMGYSFDFSLVKLPIMGEDGFPNSTRGVTVFPGLYFVGLPWLFKMKSGLLIGVGEDAEYIARVIAAGRSETTGRVR